MKKVLTYRSMPFAAEETFMFTVESFCNSVWGTSYAKVLSNVSKDGYKEFQIPKKGGMRTISCLETGAPLGRLQRCLLNNFLERQDIPVCVKGFRKGESYRSFLYEHIGSRFFLRLDIADFFPSITAEWIKNELSGLLVCDSNEGKDDLLNLIADIVTLEDKLPQGACTSPAVSNLVMARIDQRITKYCQAFHMRYTRYADDLLFSSDDFCYSEKKWFIRKMKYILRSKGLALNYSKIKFGEGEFALNGYIISDRGIRLSRNRLSDIKHTVAFVRDNHDLIDRCGVEAFLVDVNKLPLKYRNLRTYPFKTVFQLLQYLCGYRAFLISMMDDMYAQTSFQKELLRLIYKIEAQIILLT